MLFVPRGTRLRQEAGGYRQYMVPADVLPSDTAVSSAMLAGYRGGARR